MQRLINSRYVSLTCPEEHLTTHNPPLVYDLNEDVYEMYPLHNAHQQVQEIRMNAIRLKKEHEKTIIKVREQLGKLLISFYNILCLVLTHSYNPKFFDFISG